MYYTVTFCPCCQETDVAPDFDQELEAVQYEVAECSRCRRTDEENQLLFDEGDWGLIPF